MPRLLVKGGIWKNTEDEILKVAVMKYGKNQWSRIASLLHKKTAKQCKARWYEWLDPGIKKTEWNREEDEKLLHLAKLMPTQWRTIAPMVGRTANQCLERYEYLLDQAQIQESGINDLEDPRKLRPGEVDPNPETKPARPDPVDMDEDELEMLSEARARLANTQGKKAKRKAREKQLDEARRLATLQKKRELRAAGVNLILLNKLKRCCDLNFEIPFEKKPALGFFDTSKEAVDPSSEEFKALRMKEYTRRDRTEILERRKDKEKLEKKKESDLMGVIMKNSSSLPGRRSKLVLPKPQISESELEEVVKLGNEAEIAKSIVSNESDSLPTKSLLDDYSLTPLHNSESIGIRTPLTSIDSVKRDAQTLISLNMVETPLKGGSNVPINEAELTISGSKPHNQLTQTPNTILASPYLTPSRGLNKEFTPLRDNLSINKDSTFTSGNTTPASVDKKITVGNLRHRLSALPKPSDDFEITIPEEEQGEEQKADKKVVDAAEEDEKKELLKKMQEKHLFEMRHESVKRNLPIPSRLDHNSLNTLMFASHDPQTVKAQELINREMAVMLEYDISKNVQAQVNDTRYTFYEPAEMEYAKVLIEQEMMYSSQYKPDNWTQKYSQIWETCFNDSNVLSLQKPKQHDSTLDLDQLKALHSSNQAKIAKNLKSFKKMEDRLKILNGGYSARQDKSSREFDQLNQQILQAENDLSAFCYLQKLEEAAAVKRLTVAKEALEKAKKLENALQMEYTNLTQATNLR